MESPMKKFTVVIMLLMTIVLFIFSSLNVFSQVDTQVEMHPERGDQYFTQFTQQEGFDLLNIRVDSKIESVKDLLNRAQFKMLYGMDAEAKLDIENAYSINPYAVYLIGFYGPDGIINVIENQPVNALHQLSYKDRLVYYSYKIENRDFDAELDSTQLVQLVDIIELMSQDQMSEASQKLEPILDDNSSHVIFSDLKSILFEELGDLEKAKEILLDIIKVDPLYYMAWFNLGKIEKLNGDLVKADLYFDTAISLSTNMSKAYFERAMIQKMLGDYKSAEEFYSSIIKSDGLLSAEALLNRGLTRKILGNYQGAIEDLTKVLKVSPEKAEVYKNRGNLFILTGMAEEAIEDYTKAIRLKSNYAEAFHNRALAYYLNNEEVKACDDLNTSVELNFDKALDKQFFFCK